MTAYGDTTRIALGRGNTLVVFYATSAVQLIYDPGSRPAPACALGANEIDTLITALEHYKAELA